MCPTNLYIRHFIRLWLGGIHVKILWKMSFFHTSNFRRFSSFLRFLYSPDDGPRKFLTWVDRGNCGLSNEHKIFDFWAPTRTFLALARWPIDAMKSDILTVFSVFSSCSISTWENNVRFLFSIKKWVRDLVFEAVPMQCSRENSWWRERDHGHMNPLREASLVA